MPVHNYAAPVEENNCLEYPWLTKEAITAFMKLKEALLYLARNGEKNNAAVNNILSPGDAMACMQIKEALLYLAQGEANSTPADEWLTKDEAMADLKIKEGLLYKFLGLKVDPLVVHQEGSVMWFLKSDLDDFRRKRRKVGKGKKKIDEH